MSRGFGAFARKSMEDEELVIYEYGCSNWNDPQYANKELLMDGLITIRKSCLPEPEIREKLKRMPSGRKRLVTKKIPVWADCAPLIRGGAIEVENSRNCWEPSHDDLKVDMMACRIINDIFRQYQMDGELPERAGYYV